jgi:hypothetical protein
MSEKQMEINTKRNILDEPIPKLRKPLAPVRYTPREESITYEKELEKLKSRKGNMKNFKKSCLISKRLS